MGNDPKQPTAMNRRSLLSRGAAAGLVLAAGNTSAQEKPARDVQSAAKPAPLAATPNLNPPVVQVKAGRLRGFRDGQTLTFLGIPYAEAERFEMPKAVKAWDGIKSAQTWGPVCPIPQPTSVGGDDFVFPHRYWVENEHCQVLNIWTQNTAPAAKKPVMVWMHGGGFTKLSNKLLTCGIRHFRIIPCLFTAI